MTSVATACSQCPLRKRGIFDPLTDAEVRFMQKFKTGELQVEAGAVLMMEGANSPHLYTTLEGLGLRYKTLETGERQVINFVLPGDFIGLQAGVMNEMQHSVEATTAMKLCVFNRSGLWSLFKEQPGRAYDLTWAAAVEEHLLGETLATLGRMNGIERVARVFVRLFDRGRSLGLVSGREMKLPYKQQDLADALGLSLVHTNKTLKKLRERQALDWQRGVLRMLDYDRLCEIGKLEADGPLPTRPLL